MKYLKVYTDFVKDMSELTDEERGRLFVMMLTYAADGNCPPPGGNERFLWQTAKKMIDAQSESYKNICERNKENITKRYSTSRNDWKQEQEQEYKQEQEQKQKRHKYNRVTDGYAQRAIGNIDHLVVLEGVDSD